MVDSRSTGLPQRRRRVILVASTDRAPKSILFADEAGDRSVDDYAGDAFGFYWTEGKGGLGWAVDAVPTLKGGSTIGIASPPAIWLPTHDTGRDMVVPTIEDAEVMQGFTRGWTDVPTLDAKGARRTGTRWKLVGNAVTTRIAEWLAGRVAKPGDVICEVEPWNQTKWPLAAAGSPGRVERVHASEFPILRPYEHLREIVDVTTAPTLSPRAIAGFHNRLRQGNLGWHPGFREAVAANDDHLAASTTSATA